MAEKQADAGVVRWGILGVGDVCEVKSGPGFYKAPGSRLVAVMRRSLDKAQDFAQRHGVPRAYGKAEELLADPEVDAVYIATRPGCHLELARMVAAAGKPCYLEKPMARNSSESLEIARIFSEANLPLFVAYYRRAQPRFIQARTLIQGGQLGDITDVTYRFCSSQHCSADGSKLGWRIEAPHSGGGLLLDVGSHALDIIDFLLGPVECAHCVATQMGAVEGCEVEDVVNMNGFVHVLGRKVPLTASWNFACGDPAAGPDFVTVSGTRGVLEISACDVGAPLQLRLTDPAAAEGVQLHFSPPAHVQQPMIESVVRELLGESGACASTAESALRTAIVLDACVVGYYGDRKDGFWDRSAEWPKNTQ